MMNNKKIDLFLEIRELVNAKTEGYYDGSYSEWYKEVFGEVFSEDVARRQFYGIRTYYELIGDMFDNYNMTEDGLEFEEIEKNNVAYGKLQALKDSIKEERVRRNDYNQEAYRQITKNARLGAILEACERYYRNNRVVVPMVKKVAQKGCSTGCHLIISDVHLGLNVDNEVNKYNEEVCKDRMNTLMSETIAIMKSNNEEKIDITLAGDLVNGVINLTNRVAEETNVMQQILKVSDILSVFIKGLQDEGFDINLRGVVGNHSRLFEDKKKSTKNENFEVVVFKMVELSTGIEVKTNGEEDFINFEIAGRDIVVSHGDKDNTSNAKQNYVNILEKKVDEVWLGHYHHLQIKDDNNTEIIVNGSVIGSDDYAVSIRKYTKPYQILRIYKKNVTSTYKIYL